MKLLMLKGLPASGKSTYAKKLADDGYVRVNKDDLRAMLHNGHWSKKNEQQVLHLRDEIVSSSLNAGKSVVVDDTNLAPRHAERLKQLAKEYGATFETKFFDVSVEECIKRDLNRLNSVGERVILDMHKQFLAPKPMQYHPPEDMACAILCDIDGTLAHMTDRGPFEWHRVDEDTYDDKIGELISLYKDNSRVILLSGRDGICRTETEEWLKSHGVHYDLLLMREPGDKRKDSIVKCELFETHIRESYQVKFVLDDRDQVVEMWRSLGLKCFQVAPGDF